MLSAMEQQPKLCNVTATDIEQLLEDLQVYLGLPRQQVSCFLILYVVRIVRVYTSADMGHKQADPQ